MINEFLATIFIVFILVVYGILVGVLPTFFKEILPSYKRRRECYCCKGKGSYKIFIQNKLYIEEGALRIRVSDKEGNPYTFIIEDSIDYCPRCGRSLKEREGSIWRLKK